MALNQQISDLTNQVFLELDETFTTGTTYAVDIDNTTYSYTAQSSDTLSSIRDAIKLEFPSSWNVSNQDDDKILIIFPEGSYLVVDVSQNSKIQMNSFLPKPYHWAIDGVDREEPDLGEQDSGYLTNDKPDRKGFNYLLNVGGNISNFFQRVASMVTGFNSRIDNLEHAKRERMDDVPIYISTNSGLEDGDDPINGVEITLIRWRRIHEYKTVDLDVGTDRTIIIQLLNSVEIPTGSKYVYQLCSDGKISLNTRTLKGIANSSIWTVMSSNVSQSGVIRKLDPTRVGYVLSCIDRDDGWYPSVTELQPFVFSYESWDIVFGTIAT